MSVLDDETVELFYGGDWPGCQSCGRPRAELLWHGALNGGGSHLEPDDNLAFCSNCVRVVCGGLVADLVHGGILSEEELLEDLRQRIRGTAIARELSGLLRQHRSECLIFGHEDMEFSRKVHRLARNPTARKVLYFWGCLPSEDRRDICERYSFLEDIGPIFLRDLAVLFDKLDPGTECIGEGDVTYVVEHLLERIEEKVYYYGADEGTPEEGFVLLAKGEVEEVYHATRCRGSLGRAMWTETVPREVKGIQGRWEVAVISGDYWGHFVRFVKALGVETTRRPNGDVEIPRMELWGSLPLRRRILVEP